MSKEQVGVEPGLVSLVGGGSGRPGAAYRACS